MHLVALCPNDTPFFNNFVNGLHLSESCAINLLMACNLPCKLCNCFRFARGCIFTTAFTLLESISIPHRDTINPNNFFEVTPKTHFFGFNLTLCSNNLSKTLIRTFP